MCTHNMIILNMNIYIYIYIYCKGCMLIWTNRSRPGLIQWACIKTWTNLSLTEWFPFGLPWGEMLSCHQVRLMGFFLNCALTHLYYMALNSYTSIYLYICIYTSIYIYIHLSIYLIGLKFIYIYLYIYIYIFIMHIYMYIRPY